MKRRIRRALNFVAFNLLFFSLYLNFIHKDQDKSLDPILVHSVSSAPVQVANPQPVEKNIEVAKGAIN